MPKQNKTHLVLIVDRSGSMENIRQDMEGGIATFIQDQKKVPGECFVTLTQFDTVYDIVFLNKPIAEVGHIDLVPRGGTALHDAMGRTINAVGAELAAMTEDERPGHVLVVVVTDGLENSSREFTCDDIKKMVTHQREHYQWDFTFIGADFDAILVGEHLGVAAAQSMSFAKSSAGTNSTWSTLSAHTTSYRGGYSGQSLSAYTDDEREAAMQPDEPKTGKAKTSPRTRR